MSLFLKFYWLLMSVCTHACVRHAQEHRCTCNTHVDVIGQLLRVCSLTSLWGSRDQIRSWVLNHKPLYMLNHLVGLIYFKIGMQNSRFPFNIFIRTWCWGFQPPPHVHLPVQSPCLSPSSHPASYIHSSVPFSFLFLLCHVHSIALPMPSGPHLKLNCTMHITFWFII